MKQAPVTLEEVVTLARQLSPLDKVRLVESVIPDVEASLESADGHPLRSAYGLCADLGPAPSSEDIQQIRDEMFGDFPRTDLP
jgi:hypothetical protein